MINAAKRNYYVFKTPTSFVSAKKVKRYYTAEQQADLDIKTSVNKIGEIVNLSQELNSLLWEKMYYGNTYDDIKELYYDICQLDVMSGIEIDKAKKEFTIDNARELRKLRKKYKEELSDKDNKRKTPHFFSHISKQKGYYNPDKKNYCKYHTSMDYLQTIVNGFRIKNPYKKDKLPFVSILDKGKFRESNVNITQLETIQEKVECYVSTRKKIFNDASYDKEERRKTLNVLEEQLISDINSEKIGFSTMYKLLSSIENKENSHIKNVLLQILFLCGNDSFKKAITSSTSNINQLQEGGNDIYLYGIGYDIAKIG